MAIHDWTRVESGIFHHFHQAWTIAILNALNGGLLPKGYSALADQRSAGLIPDVITVQRRSGANRPKERSGGAVITATRPKTRFVRTAEVAQVYAARANRIAIHHPLGQVISMIEIVSPGNKASHSALRAFVDKTTELLDRGVHVLVIDLFPPSKRDPQGIHKAIWDEIREEPFELPPDKPLTTAAYVADLPKMAYVEPFAVGDPLPDMPVYLDPDSYVLVPLEATYQGTWLTCPEDMREMVEKGIAFDNSNGES